MKIPTLLFLLAALAPALHAQGTIRATTRLLPNGTNMTTVTNPDTRTREETITDAGGKLLGKTIYYLNEQNFARGATHLDGKGKVRYKELYTFDYAGQITESKLFGANNQPLGRRVFIADGKDKARVEDYDAAGNLITKAGKPATGKAGRPK